MSGLLLCKEHVVSLPLRFEPGSIVRQITFRGSSGRAARSLPYPASHPQGFGDAINAGQGGLHSSRCRDK